VKVATDFCRVFELRMAESGSGSRAVALPLGECWLQRYAATSDEALHNYPATISDETRHTVQFNPATGNEDVLNPYPIQGATRYLTVRNFASSGPSLELVENLTLREVQSQLPDIRLFVHLEGRQNR
jgi:hypothetical protein